MPDPMPVPEVAPAGAPGPGGIPPKVFGIPTIALVVGGGVVIGLIILLNYKSAPQESGLAIETGSMGDQGISGVAGAQGPAGPAGTMGEQGPAGLPGLEGLQGLTGATGAIGAPGVTGPPGPAGESGPAGPAGTPGTPGTPGAQGEPGLTGSVSAPYNMQLLIRGESGQAFIDSLKKFNIVGRVLQTFPTTGDMEYGEPINNPTVPVMRSLVELNVPTGSGQWWFSTLAKDWRVVNAMPGGAYTSNDVAEGLATLAEKIKVGIPVIGEVLWPPDTTPVEHLSQYQIVPGDNLTRIAAAFKTTIARLLQLNPQITDPNLIYAGHTMTVPFTF
jgi:LysM repeat protein